MNEKNEKFETSVSLPEDAVLLLEKCSKQINMPVSQFAVLCLKLFLYINPFPDISNRATTLYNRMALVRKILKIKFIREEFHSLHCYRALAKHSISFFMYKAILLLAERIVKLLLKKGKSKNFHFVELLLECAAYFLRSVYRKIHFRYRRLLYLKIVIPRITWRSVKNRPNLIEIGYDGKAITGIELF